MGENVEMHHVFNVNNQLSAVKPPNESVCAVAVQFEGEMIVCIDGGAAVGGVVA
jgi:hypothetical protein